MAYGCQAQLITLGLLLAWGVSVPYSAPRMSEAQRPGRLGLTGSIGAGKSSVAALLRARGLTVLDADEQARLVTQESAVLAQIGARFPGVVSDDQLDRAALSGQVFGDPAALADLNAIVHPRVRARMAVLEQAAAQRGEPWIVQDVPLLFEGGLDAQMDAVLVVDAPQEQRGQPGKARTGQTPHEGLARDPPPTPPYEKRRRASAVIDNAGPPEALGAQVDAALNTLGIHLRSGQG